MTGHFEGQTVIEHLKKARRKGAIASAEIHGAEPSGSMPAGIDSAKDTAILLLLILILFQPTSGSLFIALSLAWLVWKTARSALLGWARLDRLHRLIQEEKWEIDHNREEEKEELTALYRAKGLNGKLLDDVISVFMADDYRLLRIMLEEELGLTLENLEHPLKQSCGAALGVALSAFLFISAWALLPTYGPFIASALCIAIASSLSARQDGNKVLEAIIWNLSCAALAVGTLYFLTRLIL